MCPLLIVTFCNSLPGHRKILESSKVLTEVDRTPSALGSDSTPNAATTFSFILHHSSFRQSKPSEMAPTMKNETRTANSETDLLLESDTHSGVRLLTLNRPRARNAINRHLSNRLCSALQRAEIDANVRVIVISAASPVFCAGVDINELREVTPSSAYEQQWLTDWPNVIQQMRKPLVVAVDGPALGGGFELVLMADVVFASRKAQFGLPEILLGTIPGAGGTVRLVESVGKGRALSMMWTAERMQVDEAFAKGVVAKLCENVLRESLEFAETVAAQSSNCVRMTKELVKGRESGWQNRASMERMMYYLSFGTEEFQDGCDRFLRRREKRAGSR
ncbi:enoyl-CoA hydratase [Gracilaria domingensis]|nr:enoyl-CoA hydratase [Gracilaria domingensis]